MLLASLVSDLLKSGGSLDDAAEMVSTMLGFAPKSKSVKLKPATKEGSKAGGKKKKKKAAAVAAAKQGQEQAGRGGVPTIIPSISTGGHQGSTYTATNNSMMGDSRTFAVPADPYYEVETIRKRQNAELLQILKEEQAAEEIRERRLNALEEEGLTPEEIRATQERFARERNEASNRMLRYTKQHEEVLALALKTAREQANMRRDGQ